MAPSTPKRSPKKASIGSGSPAAKNPEHSKVVKGSTSKADPKGKGKKVNTANRAKTRDLVRWTFAKDVKILLALHKLCKEQGVALPYDEAAKTIASYCTGNALNQHLDKLAKKADAGQVPMLNEEDQKGQKSKSKLAGYSFSSSSRRAKNVRSSSIDDIDPDDGDPDDTFGEKTEKKTKGKLTSNIKSNDLSDDEYEDGSKHKKLGKKIKIKQESESDLDEKSDIDSDAEGYVGAALNAMNYNEELLRGDNSESSESDGELDLTQTETITDVKSEASDSTLGPKESMVLKLKVNRRDLADLYERTPSKQIKIENISESFNSSRLGQIHPGPDQTSPMPSQLETHQLTNVMGFEPFTPTTNQFGGLPGNGYSISSPYDLAAFSGVRVPGSPTPAYFGMDSHPIYAASPTHQSEIQSSSAHVNIDSRQARESYHQSIGSVAPEYQQLGTAGEYSDAQEDLNMAILGEGYHQMQQNADFMDDLIPAGDDDHFSELQIETSAQEALPITPGFDDMPESNNTHDWLFDFKNDFPEGPEF